jgi:hypothetical protein
MKTNIAEITQAQESQQVENVFYAEELEQRFEMAAGTTPNLACWEIRF